MIPRLTAIGLATVTFIGLAGVPAEASPALRCRSQYFPVHVDSSTHRVYGEMCFRGRLTSRTPLQVLLHGGTYDHSYWDWPYRSKRYSYVDYATRAGYATLNLDRLGYGRSSHPDPATLDFAMGGGAVHQIVRQVRNRFGIVILNGHSMGGLVAERAAALGGVDAVIVSGLPARRAGNLRSADPLYPFYPAEQDPKFARRPWARGYLTTRPGTRAETFHYPGTYDPAILPYEEALKDTLTIAEIRSVRPPAETAARAAVPTARVVGRHDTIACRSGDCTADPGGHGADLIVENSGHSINTSLGARDFYRWTIEWLRTQSCPGLTFRNQSG